MNEEMEEQEQRIVNRADLKKYRTELPNLYDDSELDPYEFRLLAHYVRVGVCNECVRTTAEKCKMSPAQVVLKRNSLVEKGFIITTEITRKSGQDGIEIEIIDRWDENFAKYSAMKEAKRLQGKQGVHHVNTLEQKTRSRCLRGGTKEVKKEPIKNDSASKTDAQQPDSRSPNPIIEQAESNPSSDFDSHYSYAQSSDEADSVKKISPQQEMFGALIDVCHGDVQLERGKYARAAKALLKANYTAEQVRTLYAKDGEWYRYDWRGIKGQLPDIAAINGTIKRALSGEWKEEKRSNVIPFKKPVKSKMDLIRECLSEPLDMGGVFGGK